MNTKYQENMQNNKYVDKDKKNLDPYPKAITDGYVQLIQISLQKKYYNTSFYAFATIPVNVIDLIMTFCCKIKIYDITGNRLKLFEKAYNENGIYPQNGKWIIQTNNDELSEGNINKKLDFSKHYDEIDKNESVKLMSKGIWKNMFFIHLRNGALYQRNGNNEYNKIKLPLITPLKKELIEIQCGYKHALFLTFNGNVYSMGTNIKGQCGHSKELKYISQPTLILKFVENNCFMKSISCSVSYSCCVDETNHKLWYFGHGMSSPEIRLNDLMVKTAKCGPKCIILLTMTGYCYLFGSIYYNSSIKWNESMVRCLSDNIKFTNMDASGNCVGLISNDNRLHFQNSEYINKQTLLKVHDLKSRDCIPYRVICGQNDIIVISL